MTYSGGVYFYVQDHLYSTAALVDPSGDVAERYEYDAYGRVHILDANFADDADGRSDCNNPYIFTGRRVDFLDRGKLTLQINRHRYYDYYTGRWLTEDPLGIRARLEDDRFAEELQLLRQYSQGLSLYEYSGSNPLANTDAIGLFGCTPTPPSPGGGLGGIYVPNMGDISIWFKRNALTTNLLDSRTEIAFYPNECARKCCNKIVFGQIAYSYRLNWDGSVYMDFWHIDKGFPYPQGHPWPSGGIPEYTAAHLVDTPEATGLPPQLFYQQFNSCAICVQGQDSGANYGCVHWWHLFESLGSGNYKVRRGAFDEETPPSHVKPLDEAVIEKLHHAPWAPHTMFEIVPVP